MPQLLPSLARKVTNEITTQLNNSDSGSSDTSPLATLSQFSDSDTEDDSMREVNQNLTEEDKNELRSMLIWVEEQRAVFEVKLQELKAERRKYKRAVSLRKAEKMIELEMDDTDKKFDFSNSLVNFPNEPTLQMHVSKSTVHRKSCTRALGDSPKNVVCPRGVFQSKHARTTMNRGCSSERKRQYNKMKNEEKKQLRRSQKLKDSTSITPIESMTSVWFFIPLDSQDPFHRKVPTDKKFDYNSDDDSFICFKDDDEHDDNFICFEEGDDDMHNDRLPYFEEGNYMDDDDDDDDNSSVKYNSCASIENSRSKSDQSLSDKTPKKKKQVSFVENSSLVTVHKIIAWDYAYRAARKSEWMTRARDAKRFQRKIKSMEPLLSPILSSEHRAKIRETRMLTEG